MTEPADAPSGPGEFDREGFVAVFTAVLQVRGMTASQAAGECGILPSTLSRVLAGGKPPGVKTLFTMADWARLPLDAFITRTALGEVAEVEDVRRMLVAIADTKTLAERLGGAATCPAEPPNTAREGSMK